MNGRCTCPSPTWDDPFVGACEWCEEQAWQAEHGQRDEDLTDMLEGRSALAAADAMERFDALEAMGEDDDSLMLGGCGGGERDPDLEWY